MELICTGYWRAKPQRPKKHFELFRVLASISQVTVYLDLHQQPSMQQVLMKRPCGLDYSMCSPLRQAPVPIDTLALRDYKPDSTIRG